MLVQEAFEVADLVQGVSHVLFTSANPDVTKENVINADYMTLVTNQFSGQFERPCCGHFVQDHLPCLTANYKKTKIAGQLNCKHFLLGSSEKIQVNPQIQGLTNEH